MANGLRLAVRALRARPVNVPLARPFRTSKAAVDSAPLVLVDLETEQGVTGRSYLYAYTPLALHPLASLIRNLEEPLRGFEAAPEAIRHRVPQRLRLLGPHGLIAMALAGLDMAAWDARAKAGGVPLHRLLGGTARPVPAYNSCGLGIMNSDQVADEARELIAPGFKALKVRLGYPNAGDDVSVVRAVQRAVGDQVQVMADYNQSLDLPDALCRVRLLDDERLSWIEEPTRADDFAGQAAIARDANTPIQSGENLWGPEEMARSIAAGASDLIMPDAAKIGGVSGWLEAATLAERGGLSMSSHLYPEISAHLMAATPTCHWLEYVDWAAPVLDKPLIVHQGMAIPSSDPGVGIAWREDQVRRYSYA